MISILLEEQTKLAKIAPNLPVKLNEDIIISPASGSIQPKKETIVQVCCSIYFFLTTCISQKNKISLLIISIIPFRYIY